MLFSLLVLFFLKLADSTLGTMKSVFTYQGRRWLAMFAITGSQLVYLLLITRMEDGVWSFVAVGAAVMIGQVLGMSIGEGMRKETIWRLDIEMDFEPGIYAADRLRELNIPCSTSVGYIGNEKILNIKAYADSRKQTTIIKENTLKANSIDVIEIKDKIEMGE